MPFILILIVFALIFAGLIVSIFKSRKHLAAAKTAALTENIDGVVDELAVQKVKVLKRKLLVRIVLLIVAVVVFYIVI